MLLPKKKEGHIPDGPFNAPGVGGRVRVVAVIPAAEIAHGAVLVLVEIEGNSRTPSLGADIVRRAGVPVVAGIGIVRIHTEAGNTVIVYTASECVLSHQGEQENQGER